MKKKTSILMLMLVAIMAITLVGCGKSDSTSKKDSDKKETTVVSDKDKTPADGKKDELKQSSEEKTTEKVTEAPTELEAPKDYRYDIEKVMSEYDDSRFENASFLVNEDGMVIARAPYVDDGNVTPIGERYGVSVMSKCDKMYRYYSTDYSATTITELGLDDGYDELKANDESNLQFNRISTNDNDFIWKDEECTGIDEEIADIYVLAQVTNPDEIAKYAALAGYNNAIVVKAYYPSSHEKRSLDKDYRLCDITDVKNLAECENAFTVTYIIDVPSSTPWVSGLAFYFDVYAPH